MRDNANLKDLNSGSGPALDKERSGSYAKLLTEDTATNRKERRALVKTRKRKAK